MFAWFAVILVKALRRPGPSEVQHFVADLNGPFGRSVAAKENAGLDEDLAIASESFACQHPRRDLQAAECLIVFPIMNNRRVEREIETGVLQLGHVVEVECRGVDIHALGIAALEAEGLNPGGREDRAIVQKPCVERGSFANELSIACPVGLRGVEEKLEREGGPIPFGQVEHVDIGETDVAKGKFDSGLTAKDRVGVKRAVRPRNRESEGAAAIAEGFRVERFEQTGIQVGIDLVELILDPELRGQQSRIRPVVDLFEIALDLGQVRPVLSKRRRRQAGECQDQDEDWQTL